MSLPRRPLQLPYTSGHQLFELVRTQAYPVLLDSGQLVAPKASAPFGRFDIVSANPQKLWRTSAPSLPPDWQALEPPRTSIDAEWAHLPFCSGWIGYLSYDAGAWFEPSLPPATHTEIHLPLAHWGYYAWALVTDHQAQSTYLVGDYPTELAHQLSTQLAQPSLPLTKDFSLLAPFRSNMDFAAYAQAFTQVQAYLQAGDAYQINLAQRFSAPYQGDTWQAYLALRQATPAPFAAYLEVGEGQAVLSLSPERFLQVDPQGKVQTKPIKGTRARGRTPAEDAALAQELQQAAKDQAENLMIVDLLRNDLNRVCQTHTVKVPHLFALESFANVHHLVSTVEGQLAPPYALLPLLAASFPGGSITGAPKIRAMQIIDELEPHHRSLYCGALGYLDDRGHMDMNICIRTLIADQGHLYAWGGGGLVADSECAAEYQETLIKVGRLLQALDPEFAPLS